MKIFGKKKKENPQETLARLRESMDTLDKREEFLEKKIQAQLAEAKRYNSAGNKRMAVAALKRKKMLTEQQQKIAGAREKIELQMNAIEGAKMNMEIIDTLQAGAKTMSSMHRGMTAEKVDKVMDDISDQMMVSQEISDALGQQIGEPIDEDELLEELDELEEEDITDQVADLPMPGRSRVPAAKARPTEEDDLAELEAALM
jgi:charged multivesicular body protein 4